MMHDLRQTLVLFGIIGGVLGISNSLAALDTLRVGNNGNVSWTGTAFGAAVSTTLPEYKVSGVFTEVGNVPGNVIDLSNVDVVSPRVLVKTLIEAPPELLAGEVVLVETILLDVLSTVSGVTAIAPAIIEGLSLIRVDFDSDIALDEAVQRIYAAIDLVRSIAVEDAGDKAQGAGKTLVQQEKLLPEGVYPVILPVTLSPEHVTRGENVSLRAIGWGGRITAPAITDVPASELAPILLELITPAGNEDAFARKGKFGALGTFIVLDLGSPVGINRIRFYPRNTVQSAPQYPFQNDFLRQFELLIHDGQDLVLDGRGRLVPQLDDFELLKLDTVNETAVVEVALEPPQAARYVRLKSTSSFPYEIDEFEVYGQGFIGSSRYISHVYDLGTPATWGNISWLEKVIDLRRDGGRLIVNGTGTENCLVKTQIFLTEEDIADTWGDCESVARFTETLGYTNVWECFQAECTSEEGLKTLVPGHKKSGKALAAKPLSDDFSQIIVRTRTGNDPTPVLYKRKNVQRVSEDQLATSLQNQEQQMERDEYLELQPNLEASPPQVWDKGNIEEDLENWSPWSSPYLGGERSGGTQILSPGPRRYIQFSVDFLNTEIDATKVLEQLSIEYLLPPIAEELVAEIFPREVEVFESVDFTYAVRANMAFEGVKGFDSFELFTTSRVLGIDKIEIWELPDRLIAEQELNADVITDQNGRTAVKTLDGEHALPFSIAAEDGQRFTIQAVTDRNVIVRFPQITRPQGGGEMLLKIKFRGRVLLFSTLFRGQAVLSSQAGSIQRIAAGNAGFLGVGDVATASGITVLSPDINKGDLFGSFEINPNIFTPNGDNINEKAEVSYDILAVTRPTDVAVHIYDLSGRLVRQLYNGADLSGHYDPRQIPQLAWDGRNSEGNIVAPGIYLVTLLVDGDARQSRKVRTVGLVY